MSTLLLRYAAPLAAFGHTARFDNRPTATTPTVSGIQGLVAAAAGAGRNSLWPDWIADLHLAIRTDHSGELLTDYHTVNEPDMRRYSWMEGKKRVRIRDGQYLSHTYSDDLARVATAAAAELDAKGRPAQRRSTVQSRRGYVVDATFLIAVDDPTGNVTEALTSPTWAIYAGRKSCPLTEPFLLGHIDLPPEQAVAAVPTVAHPTETDAGETLPRHALLFTQPPDPAAAEDRNDRATGFKQYRSQRRWHTQITVPVAADWFAVIEQLDTAGAST